MTWKPVKTGFRQKREKAVLIYKPCLSKISPNFPESTEPQAKITVQQKELKHLLSMVQYAMAQQDIRYYLNGLLLLMEDNHLKVVATDGHRLAFALCILESTQEKNEVICHERWYWNSSELLNGKRGTGHGRNFAESGPFYLFKCGTGIESVDGKFPDYNRVIPAGYQKHFDSQPVAATCRHCSVHQFYPMKNFVASV